jgi:hypothetical protein
MGATGAGGAGARGAGAGGAGAGGPGSTGKVSAENPTIKRRRLLDHSSLALHRKNVNFRRRPTTAPLRNEFILNHRLAPPPKKQ